MIFFLILGAAIGGLSIIFILQNITPVTVMFFTYQLNGSLALVLFLAMLAGVVITILILLPGFVRDEFRVSRLRRQKQELEDELQHMRDANESRVSRAAPANLPTHMPLSEHTVVI